MNLLCVGDAGIDYYPQQEETFFGGCSYNVARHFSVLTKKNRVGIMAPIGIDRDGKSLKQDLCNFRIEDHLIETDEKTTKCEIQIDKCGERSFSSYHCPAVESFEFGEEHRETVFSYDTALISVYEQSRRIFDSFLELGHKNIFCDFTDLKDFNSNADIIRQNINSLEFIFCGLNSNEKKLIKDLEKLSYEFKKKILITLGADGSLFLDDRNRIETRLKPSQNVIDTTGAGDSFVASFLSSLSNESNNERSLLKANRYASKIITHFGSF